MIFFLSQLTSVLYHTGIARVLDYFSLEEGIDPSSGQLESSSPEDLVKTTRVPPTVQNTPVKSLKKL
jgi:hypothetical protein